MSQQKDIKKLLKILASKGWTIKIGKHYKAFHPLGGMVTIAISPSCHHALDNILNYVNRLQKQHNQEEITL